ncbi:YgfZ/GcvT domain-containing protein [Umboniibacter marinipuniceus]|uniref:Uncharacterized protein n=1 Tax=Umboniibacter marinipuniceus TaxID=569599 RepID=A0A3M0AJV9_9GAMM|nr:folate-binding protein YgfZ [Umboniibacter marinipuniceus]RMA79332.1 hypothetical protein DFR27_1772 [Umboniibacter marinipuniceus]
MATTNIGHLSIYAITGADAATFLQNQITADINKVTAEKAAFTASCDLKGRAIATFLIAKIDTGFLILVDENCADELVAHYRKYAAFSKVSIEQRSDLSVHFCAQSDQPATNPFSQQDSLIRHPNGTSAWLIQAQASSQQTSLPAARANVDAGVVFTDASSKSAFIPQIIGVDQLGGISFTKGCYLGQEIVARMKYLGKSKKSLHRAKLSGVAPHNGDELQTAEGKLAGTVVATAGELGEYQILAVISDKFVNDPLTLNGEMITELTASNS